MGSVQEEGGGGLALALLTGDPGAGRVQEANGARVYGTSLWCQVLCEAMHRWPPDAGLAMDLALWLSL